MGAVIGSSAPAGVPPWLFGYRQNWLSHVSRSTSQECGGSTPRTVRLGGNRWAVNAASGGRHALSYISGGVPVRSHCPGPRFVRGSGAVNHPDSHSPHLPAQAWRARALRSSHDPGKPWGGPLAQNRNPDLNAAFHGAGQVGNGCSPRSRLVLMSQPAFASDSTASWDRPKFPLSSGLVPSRRPMPGQRAPEAGSGSFPCVPT